MSSQTSSALHSICDANPRAETVLARRLLDLQPISLEKTNDLARMQSRIDNKYILDFSQLQALIKLIEPKYAVLEIGERRNFTYRSCYYDDAFRCYFEHHQGRRQRLKVRTRQYVDGGGMKYFEIKLKGLRGLTVKHRCETENFISSRIGAEHQEILQEIYFKQYKKKLQMDLKPSLIVGYQRCTLVALEGGERVTIDSCLSFDKPHIVAKAQDSAIKLGSDFLIVETKSVDGNGIADTALKKLGIRQASKCSKYCIGVNLTGSVVKNNLFLATVRRAQENIVPRRSEDPSSGLLLELAS